jgi:fatty-acyl-CoA synthase
LSQGIKKGETVCLLMPGRPDYLAIWLGLTSIGAVAALINTNLTGAALAHCITLAGPRHIIVDARLDLALEGLETSAMVWRHGEAFAETISGYSGAALTAEESRDVTLSDPALLIYTSGTTGLPKAAFVSHHRVMMWTHWFAGMMDTSPADRMYNCLPMYHSIGGAVATGAVLVNGGSVAIRERFSASGFWDDIVRFDCTLFQYIGELCRYLVHAPADPNETRHRLRLACGNGLRGDIWEEFKRRFHIPQVLEFYAATEANVSLFNVEGRAGAIGRVPPFIAHRSALALVKFDVARSEPLRSEHGFCMRCVPNETGEAIGRIASDDHGARFDGYTDRAATERKILRDVFEPGDAWFRTGDLMRRDDGGFYYFVDRIGDTFRWKGENVATSEVAAAIAAFPGVADANVYGVEIPGADGRAGMAEIVCAGAIDLAALRDHLSRALPRYAHPVLLRMRDKIDVTATFKHMKRGRLDDHDPRSCPDALYILHPERRAYVMLDAPLYERLRNGEMRL